MGRVEVADQTRPWDPSAGTATIKGQVLLSGEVPARRPIVMDSEPQCSGARSGPPLDESVIVGDGRGLANVVVWVGSGLEGWIFESQSEHALLEQKGCVFMPHVLGVQAGQKIQIRNRDPVSHNVRAIPKFSDGFNIAQPAGGTSTRVLNHAEMGVRVRCDMHKWMGATIAVLRNPFFRVTGEDGTFELPKLPPGEYGIEFWHEVYGKRSLRVTLAEGQTEVIEFTFE
ncbi:MAG: hypothetical protein HY720_30405 [Planctomycetes bacterium]|nr:hypothetical protein [Planctomycetota bacterium]